MCFPVDLLNQFQSALSRVEGFFPQDSNDSIVPRSWFIAARARYDANPQYWDQLAAAHDWRHGVDVGDGRDDHGFASWRGSVLYSAFNVPTKGDREDVSRAATLARKLVEEKPGLVGIDRVGVGAGSLSILKEQRLK